jgi:precorrin-8X/cobalt-precorrin-8 methylmutase
MPGLKPHEIEVRSMAIIDGLLPAGDWDAGERTVIKRLVHTSGDPSLAEVVRFSDGAVAAGVGRCEPAAQCSRTRTWRG